MNRLLTLSLLFGGTLSLLAQQPKMDASLFSPLSFKNADGPKIAAEQTYVLDPNAKDRPDVVLPLYLRYSDLHQEDQLLLHYVSQSGPEFTFFDHYYDKALNRTIKTQTFSKKERQDEPWKADYPWFEPRSLGTTLENAFAPLEQPEKDPNKPDQVVEGVYVLPGGGYKPAFYQRTTTWKYSVQDQCYRPSNKQKKVTKVAGPNEEDLHLHTTIENHQTGGAVAIVGYKTPKQVKPKTLHHRKFQVLTVSPEGNVDYKELLEFDDPMYVHYAEVIPPYGKSSEFVRYNDPIGDHAAGDALLVFAPTAALLTKAEYLSKTPGAYKIVVIDKEGTIKSTVDLQLPYSGWSIDRVVRAEDGSVYLYGLGVVDAFGSTVTGRLSTTPTWTGVQIVKLTPEMSLSYVQTTSFAEMDQRIVHPTSQLESKGYQGGNLEERFFRISDKGELFVGGHIYEVRRRVQRDAKGQAKTNSEGKAVLEDYRYYNGPMILLHFDPTGKLAAQYSVTPKFSPYNASQNEAFDKNPSSSINPFPQLPIDFYFNADGTNLYWVYEQEFLNLDQFYYNRRIYNANGLINTLKFKQRQFRYPLVAKIDLAEKKISDFSGIGAPKRYFIPEGFQYLHVPGKYLYFAGEDFRGAELWVGRLDLE